MDTIGDFPFNLPYMTYDESRYDEMLSAKIDGILESFKSLEVRISKSEIQIIPSPKKYFRHRCRFGVFWYNEKLQYRMWEHGGPQVIVESFPIASVQINTAMAPVLATIAQNSVLHKGIKAVNYLSTISNALVISLVYDCEIEKASWIIQANLLQQKVLELSFSSVSIIGRSKKQTLVVGDDFVYETLTLNLPSQPPRQLRYKQVEASFSNPNGFVNEIVLSWMHGVVKDALQSSEVDGLDLLEMFCGNCNHTVALADCFPKVLCVELNKALCEAGRENLVMNNIHNVEVIACDSAKFAFHVLRNRRYVHNGTTYEFGSVLVDPPRCGLDEQSLQMIPHYSNIIYISCNPEALARDLQQLCKTHKIVRFAVFDHFAYTPHLESGVLLQKIR